MATELSPLAKTKSTQIVQKPQLVLEIEGLDRKFGVGAIRKYVRIGDPGLLIGNDWVIGGFSDVDNQLDAISLDGTSTTIAQQLLQDKGGVSSVSGISIALLDIDGEITRLITPGVVLDDVLGKKANVYLGYQETAFPQDFVQIFAGVIDEIISGPVITLNIASPEQKKRGQVLPAISTKLTAAARFRSDVLQGILYRTRQDVVGSVTIQYTNTVAAGDEEALVAATNLTVKIQSGVTTADQVRSAIEKSLEAVTLVTAEVVDGFGGMPQTTMAPTGLTSDTTLTVVETKGLVLPAASEGFRTYVRIGDEIIEYTGLTETTITGCTRAALEPLDDRAFGEHHTIDDEVTSFYRLQGAALDLALKIMLSGGPEYYATDVMIQSVNEIEEVGNVQNALYFESINIADKWGLSPGSKIKITGSPFAGNNVVDAEVIQVVATRLGSYAILGGDLLTTEISTPAVAAIKTKWNVWPADAGLGLGGDEVDLPRFEDIIATFSSSIFTYDCYIRDTVEVKDFIDQDLLFPTGAFSLPRKGKISVGFTSPPLGGADLIGFDSSNTIKPEQNKIYRGISRYFYNNIVYKYNEDLLDDGKFLSGDLTVDADSKSRIKVGNKTFVIPAKHLRPSEDTTNTIERLAGRFLDRYKFAAERIKIQAFYGTAFSRDVGDIVAFGGEDLQLPNAKTGLRGSKAKLYEVVNKSLSITSGVVTLDLVNTAFSLEDARYGVISPASQTDLGSTTTRLKLKNSFDNLAPLKERPKWEMFFGEVVLIHDEDWTYEYERTLVGFDPSDGNIMIIDPALPFSPSNNAVVEVRDYPLGTDPTPDTLYKSQFVYTNPSIPVTTGVSTTSFNVDAGDVGLFLVDQPVILHADDALGIFVTLTPEAKIVSVAGTLVTVDTDLGVIPDSTFTVELIGYPDSGAPYRYT